MKDENVILNHWNLSLEQTYEKTWCVCPEIFVFSLGEMLNIVEHCHFL